MRHEFKGDFNNIILKPLLLEDIESLRILRNKDENRKCFLYQEIISQEEQEKWYKKYLEKESDIMFSAYLKDDVENPIGYVALYDIDENINSCEFGRILVNKEKINEKGIGFQITKCCCDIAFEKLGLKKIHLEVFHDNIPALKTYLKVGFAEKRRYLKENKEVIYMELEK